ncbi:hypothetical protein EWM64_g2008 [Hericium alpestre]|uniref:Uncharacterized protein n=1 Tax=Hericium alpestre TaxID=135208 RepID=A0A4Z0A6N9_9AGAM|nr:hypothetical protein EWM64_g2008 [Hericium alpestre]
MAHWGAKPDYDLDDEIQSLRKQITNQDLRYSSLESQLLKTNETLEETKATLYETVQKLRVEADRAVHLGEQLEDRTESLETEKIYRQNAENALQVASEKIRADEAAAKEMQAAIEALSQRETGSSSAVTDLTREKARLEARLRELEINMQQVVNATTPARNNASRRGRPRASSTSDIRVPALEHELTEIKTASARYQTDLQRATEKLGRVETDLMKSENEKMALERRFTTDMRRMEEQLLEKDTEIERLQGQQGDASYARQREEELMARVEEEEAKVAALEKLMAGSRDVKALENALQRTEKRLKQEMSKVKQGEDRHADLVREREEALDGLDEARAEVQHLAEAVRERDAQIAFLNQQESDLRSQLTQLRAEQQQFSRPGSTTFDEDRTPAPAYSEPSPDASGVEKLLSAIDRLRSERDGLRRDLEFLQMESKFATQALEKKLAAATAAPVPAYSTPAHDELVQDLRGEVQRLRDAPHPSTSALERRAVAGLVLVNHLQTKYDGALEDLHCTESELSKVCEAISADTDVQEEQGRYITVLEQSKEELQDRLDTFIHSQDSLVHQRDEILVEVARLQDEVNQLTEDNFQSRTERSALQHSVAEAETQLAKMARSLENMESERDSLSLQVQNYQTDLEAAQEELADAEKRYSTLQSQQLSTMSSGEVTRSLKDQIEMLEGRVLRRTEQIGLHQHDIKRLETNLRLQEDRINEMTGELDTAMTEKESMVEDCAEAREARDLAQKRVEDLEEEVAALEAKISALNEERDRKTASLTASETMSRKAIQELESTLREVEATNADLTERLENESAQHRDTTSLLQNVSSTLETIKQDNVVACDSARQITLAFAVSQVCLAHNTRSLWTERTSKTRLDKQLETVHDELRARLDEISSLQKQLESVRADSLQATASAEALNQTRTTELESDLQQLQHANAELEMQLLQLQDQLAKSQEELRVVVEQHANNAQLDDVAGAELEQLRSRNAEEIQRLQDRIVELEKAVADAHAAHEAADLAHKASVEELTLSKAELEERIRDTVKQWESDKATLTELRLLQDTHASTVTDMQGRLDHSAQELQKMIREHDELKASMQRGLDEASSTKDDFEARLSEATNIQGSLEKQLADVASRHAQELEERLQEVEANGMQVDDLKSVLAEETRCHAEERAALKAELHNSSEQLTVFKSTEALLQQEISAIRTRLEQALTERDGFETERKAIEGENTELRSRTQTALALEQDLQDKLRKMEHQAAGLSSELVGQKSAFENAQAACLAAQMQLNLASSHHQREVAHLQKQLDQLQESSPKELIEDLIEKVQLMDELMAQKNTEIEANDDVLLALHKEKKDLVKKMDKLTHKVQRLQVKLAAQDAAAGSTPPNVPTSSSSYSARASHSFKASPPAMVIPPVPPVPALSVLPVPLTPRSRMRMASGPSTMSRAKTPEPKAYTPVFRAKTPEPKHISLPAHPDPQSSTFSKGKKRPAPDDSDFPTPVQGFTPDGAYDPTRNTDATTPRMRKSLRTAFTPTRHTAARPTPTHLPTSPARVPVPAIIYDVTNSPRSASAGEQKAAKRGWLGKIRGGSSQQPRSTTAPGSSRPSVFEKAPFGHAS